MMFLLKITGSRMRKVLLNHNYKYTHVSQQLNQQQNIVKGIVQPKMRTQSSFTHPHVVPNLYFCVEHKRCCILMNAGVVQTTLDSIDCHCNGWAKKKSR